MNPAIVAWAMTRRYPVTTLVFVLVIAVSVALGVGITAQERALREGGAMASDRFDLLVAAPGSAFDIVLSTIFLRPTAVELLDPEIVAKALTDPRAEYAAPLGFGDNVQGLQIVGTIAAFADRLSAGLQEGRHFAAHEEAVVGASVPFPVGATLEPAHGTSAFIGSSGEVMSAPGDDGHEHYVLSVVGRMKPTGTPWDRAIVVPIEAVWEAHGLPNGHPAGSAAIGPPFDPSFVPGLPAIVMKGEAIADMYGLRGEYRTSRSTAFFPAEVLLQLFDLMSNIRQAMSLMAVVTQVLSFLSILAGLVALMKLFERQLAVLRALGASSRYVFGAVWLFTGLIIVTGVTLGLGLGYVVAEVASAIIGRATGVALSASLGEEEITLALGGAVLGIALATVPAGLLYRRPVAELLR